MTKILAIDPGYSSKRKTDASQGVLMLPPRQVIQPFPHIALATLGPLVLDAERRPDLVVLDWINADHGVYPGRSSTAGTIAVLRLFEVQMNLRSWFDAHGFPVLCIPHDKWRLVSNWNSGLKRWDAKKKKNVKWGYDSFRLYELERQGVKCGTGGLNSPHLRDAYTLGVFAAGLKPAQQQQYLFQGVGHVGVK